MGDSDATTNCPICLCPILSEPWGAVVPCGHPYHRECWDQIASNHAVNGNGTFASCAVCNGTTREFVRVFLEVGNATPAKSDVILKFPFNYLEADLEEASMGLKELGGDAVGVEIEPGHMNNPAGPADGGDTIIIRQGDLGRLSSSLSMTLVDFWMRWISRGESQSNSTAHFFSAVFMTKLKADGPEAVSSFVGGKNINVFEKKLIFIPVLENSHWSLYVVVNPGLIANSYDEDISEDEDHSFILALDSGKIHSKHTYARHIRDWLNYEWKGLGLGRGATSAKAQVPFDKDSILLRSPKIPYQENERDSGVFVCRYAYSLYLMRHQKFTWNDVCERPSFTTLITNGAAFQFHVSDIARIRRELKMLLDRLSQLYRRENTETGMI